jgi:RNA polymerase sigma-70 factor (ECF subfamily)
MSGAGSGDDAGTDRRPDPLVSAARAGSRDAFGQLVLLHQQAVIRAALAALGNRAEAEDAAQEAFVLAWRKLPGFRAESSFRTWVLTIAWRRALTRRRHRRRWAAADEALGAWGERVAGAAPDPERSAVASDLAQRVGAAIARLTPGLRDTLLLAASGDYSYTEISEMLEVPVGTIKWRVAEARRIVAAAVGRERRR